MFTIAVTPEQVSYLIGVGRLIAHIHVAVVIDPLGFHFGVGGEKFLVWHCEFSALVTMGFAK